jgi:chromosome condensin MukBEF MukE localization factor
LLIFDTCCGLEVHYSTYAVKSVKAPGNTFDLNPSGKELCRPSVIFITEERQSTLPLGA